jgi:Lrp/AsnC family transcriptional regulator
LLDKIDRKILELLQVDATLALAVLAEQVNLTQTPCWRRVQRLEADGYITRRVALCDPVKLGVGVTVFVSIKTRQHNAKWFDQFAASVSAIPEVVEFYRMSGDIDYLLRVVVADIAGYDLVYKKLIRSAELFDVSSSFAMEQIKFTTALPVSAA